jgi:hypothetical protein
MLEKWTTKQNWGTIFNQLVLLFEHRIHLDPFNHSKSSQGKISGIVSQFTQN